MSEHTPAPDADKGASRRAGAFDIRVFIGSLIGIYGVVLVLVGLFGSDGNAINLGSGAGMVVVAAGFFLWARIRPVVVVPPDPGEGSAGH